ncbi:MAG TPA: hypothetical protein VKB80_13710 [Kofleriaceae bacterium]|nr:hypothetical protein [Kofleriaceae bacterium]
MRGRGFWLAVCLGFAIGCGSVESNDHEPDASGAGSGATDAAGSTHDGQAPDARPAAPITVTVLTDQGDVDTAGVPLPRGLPRQGAEVYFIQSSGETEMVVTGGAGVATSRPVVDDTSVVVVRPQAPTQFSVIAYLALSPDTSVVAGPRPDAYVPPSPGETMTITTPAATGASSYNLSMACLYSASLAGSTFTVTLADPCDGTGRTILVTAVDDAGAPIAYTRTTADLTPGASITMPATQAPTTFVAALSNLPPNVASADVNVQTYDEDVPLAYWTVSGAPSGGGLVVQIPSTPAGNFTSIDARFWDESGEMQWNHYTRYTADTATNVAIDAAPLMPFTPYPRWDPATGTVSWEEVGTMNRADIATAHGVYFKRDDGISVELRFVFPHVGTSATLPAFPPELAAIAPAAGDGGYINEVYLIDDIDREGYLAMVETADADARNAAYERYGTAAEAWVSGGGFK